MANNRLFTQPSSMAWYHGRGNGKGKGKIIPSPQSMRVSKKMRDKGMEPVSPSLLFKPVKFFKPVENLRRISLFVEFPARFNGQILEPFVIFRW